MPRKIMVRSADCPDMVIVICNESILAGLYESTESCCCHFDVCMDVGVDFGTTH